MSSTNVLVVPSVAGALRPDYDQLPRLSAADANRIECWSSVAGPLRLLLGEGKLPDAALVELAAAAGPGGTHVLAGNLLISEDLWCAVYVRTAGPARPALLRHRVLSDRQRHQIVHLSRERSPWVLGYAAHLLTDEDLARLATYKLSPRSSIAVTTELADRRDGVTTAQVRQDGSGSVVLRHDPAVRVTGDPGTLRVAGSARATLPMARLSEDEEDVTRTAQAVGVSVAEYVVSRLGEDQDAWARLGVVLSDTARFPDSSSGDTSTWADVVDEVGS